MNNAADVNTESGPPAVRARVHSYSHRFTAASLSPDRACQESYTLITLARAWNRHPSPHTNTLSDGLAHRHPLAQLREIHPAVTQHSTAQWKQEGRFGTDVFSASCFSITDDLCVSGVYSIVSLSDHISSAGGVRRGPHTGSEFVTYSICAYTL